MRLVVILGSALSLAACAGSSAGYSQTANSSSTARVQGPPPVLVPSQSVKDAGLATIIGANSAALMNRFGKARIDLKEGSARKLQFADDKCVIDIFLYPLQVGQDPVATHIEARNRKSGAAEDKAVCARGLTKPIMR